MSVPAVKIVCLNKPVVPPIVNVMFDGYFNMTAPEPPAPPAFEPPSEPPLPPLPVLVAPAFPFPEPFVAVPPPPVPPAAAPAAAPPSVAPPPPKKPSSAPTPVPKIAEKSIPSPP